MRSALVSRIRLSGCEERRDAFVEGMNQFVTTKLLNAGANVFMVDKYGFITSREAFEEANRRPDVTLDDADALRGRGDDQLLMMGGYIFVGFTFWMILAHGIFAIFLAESGIGSESLAIFRTTAGLAMLAVGAVVGGIVAYVFYAVTVISLPMLVDRDVDFLTAIIKSLRAVQANSGVMLAWAVFIALALFAAMIPAFLGLLVVLPVLGHATWHLYRRTVNETGSSAA